MRENFPASLAAVLKYEGGYSNDPRDNGGETNKGITKATYDAYRSDKGKPARSVRFIGNDEVADIYRTRYWDAIDGDYLPAGVDFAVFDFAVNSGPARAAKFLQQIVAAPVDGKVGPKTVEAASAMDAAQIVRELCGRRMAYLKGLDDWPHFGKGWTSRVTDVLATALSLTKAGAADSNAPSAPSAGDKPTPAPIPVPTLPPISEPPVLEPAPVWLRLLILIAIVVAVAAIFFLKGH